MNNFKSEDLEIKFSMNGDTSELKWLGRSEARNPSDALNPYLDSILEKLSGKKLVVDYCALEYMNSSTVPPIIRFVKACDKSNIETTIQYNSKSEWQTASFKPLQTICTILKTVKVVGV